MATYLKKRIGIDVSLTKNGPSLISRPGDKDVYFDCIYGLEEASIRKMALPSPTVNLDIMAGDQVTHGRILYVEADSEIQIKLGSTLDTGISIIPVVSESSSLSSKPGSFYLEGDFSHVYVSVSGDTSPVNLIVLIVGA